MNMNPSNDEVHQMEASRLTSTCPLCFIIFCDKFTRNRHIRIVHEDQPKVENNMTELPKNEVKCPQCKKMFKHGISLRTHIKQHETNSETFICSDCSKKFTRKDNLFKHRERIHKSTTFTFQRQGLSLKKAVYVIFVVLTLDQIVKGLNHI